VASFSFSWQGVQGISSLEYVCGYCGNRVASSVGWTEARARAVIAVCPHCTGPTISGALGAGGAPRTIPGVRPGEDVEHVPERVVGLYNEARDCYAAGAYTSSVLAARKLLMNIAVEQGAPEGGTFASYVDHLAGAGYVPPNGKVWVDQIRTIGNEATHEIDVKTSDEAERLLAFLEMLLKFIYEFPAKAQTT
jgi:hypothetical protein